MLDPATLRSLVERHFRVYETREEKLGGEDAAHLFFLMVEQAQFDEAYEAARRDILAADEELLVFLRREGGEDILFVAPRPKGPPTKNRTNVALLIATLITTTTAGAVFWEGFVRPDAEWRWSLFWDPTTLFWGSLTFALPLMLILGIHETAHFIAARKHGLRASLPYFIPVPPILFFPIGTFGAFIRLKDPLPDRKALFDVGASGPLAGFVIAVPLLILGMALTADAAVEVPDFDRPLLEIDGLIEHDQGLIEASVNASHIVTYRITSSEADWQATVTATVHASNGTLMDATTIKLDEGETYLGTFDASEGEGELRIEWDDKLIEFGDPLLIQMLQRPFGDNDYLTHPTFFAAWVGLLVTGINLLPAGQLDGGHVSRAVLGDKTRFAGMLSLGLLMFLAFQFSSWLLMALFLVMTGLHHPPPLNDRTPLGRGRQIVALVVLAVFALTFVPVPIIV